MKKTLVFFFVTISLLAFSCDKQGSKPGHKPGDKLPTKVQEFISGSTNCTCEPFVDLYFWKEQYVYVFSCKGPVCNCITLFSDEKGGTPQMAPGYKIDDFKADARFERNIWTCGE